MAKALKVQIMVFENQEEVVLIMKGLHLIKDSNNYSERERTKIKELLNEFYKVNAIFEAQSNNS